MGRFAGAPREERLTEPIWHEGPIEALTTQAEAPVLWSVRLDSEAASGALAVAAHTDRDLADFAAAPDAGNRLVRRRLTRALLAHLAGVRADAILFGRSADGAPTILSPKGWHVSVAGPAPLCLIGVSREPLGVDVEPQGGGPPLWDMVTSEEAASLRAMPSAERPPEWLRRWTAKEAHAKRLGCARRADPALIRTTIAGDGRLLAESREGRSLCRVREMGGRIETVALAAAD